MNNRLKLLMIALCTVFVQNAFSADFIIKGSVCDNKGNAIPNVVVNNGLKFTTTNNKGEWELLSDSNICKFISVSVPSAYKLSEHNGVASGFYASISEIVKNGCKHNFVLTPRNKKCYSFNFVVISDPQVRNEAHCKRWKEEAITDLQRVCDSLSNIREVVTMSLGDLVWDNMFLYDEYAKSMGSIAATAFQCIGNHDFDLRYADLHNMPVGTPAWGEQRYGNFFGPTDYSFNIGKTHIVTLKSIDYYGNRKYREAFTQAQLEWLRNDLSYVEKGTLVLINLHAAGWNTVSGSGNITNAAELAEITKDYNVHVFAGHTHFMQNVIVNNNLYQHNIGAVCGAWWQHELNRCGSPNGYLICQIDGANIKWHYKPTHGSVRNQMKVYAKGDFRTQPDYIVANVWDWDASCRVELFDENGKVGDMERFTDCDYDFRLTLKKKNKDDATQHLFRMRSPKGTHENLRVVFTNRFGEKYEEKVAKRYTPDVQIIAHRGLWKNGNTAQNSIESLNLAAEADVYGSEFDVQMTNDGIAVVCHDPSINGMTISEHSFDELRNLKLSNGESLPLLSDYLNKGAMCPNIKMILEIKPQKSKGAEQKLTHIVIEEVRQRAMLSQVEFISFSYDVCTQIISQLPSSVVYYLGGDKSPEELSKKGFAGIDYNYKEIEKNPKWVVSAHSLGMKVNAWTTDSEEQISRMKELGVDFITTNEVYRSKKVLK